VTLAKTLVKLWRLRLWVGIGVVVAGAAAVGSTSMSHSTVYATASTQMVVDSPNSALANASVDLTGYVARAGVFARLMTSAAALQYIGKAAGIDGNLIEATGPVEINGSPTASHAPVAIVDGKDLSVAPTYELSLVQNPSLPTVVVYATAPTTAKAIALANGAVTGFASFVNQLSPANIPLGQRVEIRELGQATGGMVDASASKSMALLVFVGVFAVWCWLVLFISRLRTDLRAAKRDGSDEGFDVSEEAFAAAAAAPVATDFPRFSSASNGQDSDADGNGNAHANGTGVKPSHRAWATTRLDSRP
jgi:hypothetical protein